MAHHASKDCKTNLRTIQLSPDKKTGQQRAMIFQRMAAGGVMAVCGPVGRWGTVDYHHARWYTPERGRWVRSTGGGLQS